MTIYAGSRTWSGITLRTRETTRLDMMRTAMVETPMPSALMAEVVTANVGHMPSMSTRVGFSRITPL